MVWVHPKVADDIARTFTAFAPYWVSNLGMWRVWTWEDVCGAHQTLLGFTQGTRASVDPV